MSAGRHIKRHLLLAIVLALVCPQVAIAQADQSASSPVPCAGIQEKKQLPAKDDISTIGRRKLGNQGLGNWYSLQEDIQMGREYSKVVETSLKLLDDPIVTEYVNRVGQNIVRNSDAKVPFAIKVIDSNEINAFSLPGGFLYVNSGIIMAADGEAELAGIMAHEIAHVAARHATRQMTRSNIFKLASLPLTFVGGGIAIQAAAIAVSHATPLALFKFSRGFEAEADYLGLEYAYAAGYDPQAFIAFLERAAYQNKKKTERFESLFATHPKTTGRIKKGQEEIARILPARESYIVNTSEFDDVKARLLGMEKGHAEGEGNFSLPRLRRRPVPPSAGDIDPEEDEKSQH